MLQCLLRVLIITLSECYYLPNILFGYPRTNHCFKFLLSHMFPKLFSFDFYTMVQYQPSSFSTVCMYCIWIVLICRSNLYNYYTVQTHKLKCILIKLIAIAKTSCFGFYFQQFQIKTYFCSKELMYKK